MSAIACPIRRGGRVPTNRPRRLLCLPPAGAGASIFYPWLDSAPADIEVCPVSVPGREDRMREPLPESITALADATAPALANALDRPYAVVGYSMGALLGYEMLLRWQAMGLRQPDLFITLSARAPSVSWQHEKPLHTLDAPAFRNLLRDVGGTPSEVLDNEDVMGLFEPILRNDFRISETYQRKLSIALDTPILAIHARRDVLIGENDVASWQQCTRSAFTLEIINEGHMLSREALLEIPHRIDRYWK